MQLDPAAEVQTFAVISEEIARGDSGLADKLVQNWKVSVLLRNLAPRHLQERWFPRLVGDPSFLLAHCLTEPRGASDRWLPYNVPEAAMHTKAVLAGDKWVINGRKQLLATAMTRAFMPFTPTPSLVWECCKAHRAFLCRAIRPVSLSVVATRRWAGAS